MRAARTLAATAVLTAALLGAVGCSSPGNPSATGRTPTGAPTPPPLPATAATAATAATPAGTAEARALAPLPTGAAKGSAVLAYSGVGEVRAPFSGQCSHGTGTTRLNGAADTAQITVDVTLSGARVQLQDGGLSATSDLTTGRFVVSGNHLSLAAHLAHDGEQVGSLQLEITCGG